MELWWVFPAAVLIATIAISSGISGALFFSPFFMLIVGLSPAQAIGAGLLTEVFGMGNGLRSYVRQRVVDYGAARWILAGAIPAVMAGALLSHQVPSRILKIIFGAGLSILAILLFRGTPEEASEDGSRGADPEGPADPDEALVEIRTLSGECYRFPRCGRGSLLGLSVLGGGLTGLISAGLPEVSTTQMVLRCRMPARVAVATSVFALAITAVAGAAMHALAAEPAWEVVKWSIPGVLIGSTIGSHVGKHLPARAMERGLAVVFMLVGLLVLGLEVLA